jgi:hypothetical protein
MMPSQANTVALVLYRHHQHCILLACVGGDDCLPFEWHMHRIKAWPHLLKRLDRMNAWLLTQQSAQHLYTHIITQSSIICTAPLCMSALQL